MDAPQPVRHHVDGIGLPDQVGRPFDPGTQTTSIFLSEECRARPSRSDDPTRQEHHDDPPTYRYPG